MTDIKDKKMDEMEDLFSPLEDVGDDELFELDELDILEDIESMDIKAVGPDEDEDDISYMFADGLMDDSGNDTGDLTNATDSAISADAGKKKKIIIGAVALLVILAGIGVGVMMFMESLELIAEAPVPIEGVATADQANTDAAVDTEGEQGADDSVDGAETSSNGASESKPTAEPMAAALAPVTVAVAQVPAAKPEPVAKPVATRTSSGEASFGITGVRFQSEGETEDVIIETSGDPTGNYKSFSLREPQRIVVDVLNAKMNFSGNRSTPSNSRWVSKIRYAQHPDKVRIVVDLTGKVPNWKLAMDGNSLRIKMQ